MRRYVYAVLITTARANLTAAPALAAAPAGVRSSGV
jgi:hypothetical protein